MKSILLAQSATLLMVAAPAFGAEEVSAELQGTVEVSTLTSGADAAALLPAANAADAVKAKLEAVEACFEDATSAVDLKYRVAFDVGGDGKVTAVRAVEGEVPAERAACVQSALSSVSFAPLSNPSASVTVTAGLKILRRADEPAKPAEVEVAAPEAPKTVEGQVEAIAEPSAPKPEEMNATVTTPAQPAEEVPSKPWKVSASLSQSLGQGSFVEDRFARAPFYGYALTMGGTYEVVPKYLKVGVQLLMDQELTTSNASGGTRPREFYFRDVGLSASAGELYKDTEYTGIKLTGSVGLSLPTSKTSQAQELVLGTRAGLGLSRSFEDVGPGTLSLSYAFGVRYNFSPATRGIGRDEWQSKYDACRPVNHLDGGDCASASANPRYAVSNGITVGYDFLEKFSASVSMQIVNTINNRLNNSEVGDLTGGPFAEAGHSQNAKPDEASQIDLITTAIELSYAATDNFSVAIGTSSGQSPFIQDGDNSKAPRFWFWDFSTAAHNLSSFYLDLAFSY